MVESPRQLPKVNKCVAWIGPGKKNRRGNRVATTELRSHLLWKMSCSVYARGTPASAHVVNTEFDVNGVDGVRRALAAWLAGASHLNGSDGGIEWWLGAACALATNGRWIFSILGRYSGLATHWRIVLVQNAENIQFVDTVEYCLDSLCYIKNEAK